MRLPKGTAHIREDLREQREEELLGRRERRSGSFPALPQPAAESSAARPVSEAAPTPAKAGPSPNAPRVLLVEDDLVEDDPEIRAFLSGLLRQEYQVLEGVNGEEGRRRALEELESGQYEEVLLEVGKPQGLGWMQCPPSCDGQGPAPPEGEGAGGLHGAGGPASAGGWRARRFHGAGLPDGGAFIGCFDLPQAEGAAAFSLRLHRGLLAGESVAEAVLHARREVHRQHPEDPTPLQYLLCGYGELRIR